MDSFDAPQNGSPSDFIAERISYDLSYVIVLLVAVAFIAGLCWLFHWLGTRKGEAQRKKAFEASAGRIYDAINEKLQLVLKATEHAEYISRGENLAREVGKRLGHTLGFSGEFNKFYGDVKKAVEGKKEVDSVFKIGDTSGGQGGSTIIVPVNIGVSQAASHAVDSNNAYASAASMMGGGHNRPKEKIDMSKEEQSNAIWAAALKMNGHWKNRAVIIGLIMAAQNELLNSDGWSKSKIFDPNTGLEIVDDIRSSPVLKSDAKTALSATDLPEPDAPNDPSPNSPLTPEPNPSSKSKWKGGKKPGLA